MDIILEIIKFTIPSLFVLIVSLYWIYKYFKNEKDRRIQERLNKTKDSITPLRIQAYERIVLYLERISPDNLIIRVSNPDQTVAQLQKELVFTIRTELEHNFAQQIYLSNQAWELVRMAKENTVKIINDAADKLGKNELGSKLSAAILESMTGKNKNMVSDALHFLKAEIREKYS